LLRVEKAERKHWPVWRRHAAAMKEQSEMHPQAATLPLQQPRIYSASLPLQKIRLPPSSAKDTA
jgi:hypothetical protein